MPCYSSCLAGHLLGIYVAIAGCSYIHQYEEISNKSCVPVLYHFSLLTAISKSTGKPVTLTKVEIESS